MLVASWAILSVVFSMISFSLDSSELEHESSRNTAAICNKIKQFFDNMFMSLYLLLRQQSSLQSHSIKVFPKAVTHSEKQKGRNNLLAPMALFTFSLSLNQSSVSTEGGSVSFVNYNGVRRADSHAGLAADTGLGKFYKRSLYGSIAAPLRKADCISLRDLFTSTNAQTA